VRLQTFACEMYAGCGLDMLCYVLLTDLPLPPAPLPFLPLHGF